MPVDIATAKLRRRVRLAIANCHRCPLRSTCTAPVPFSGPTPARVTVIGEAPGSEEDAAGAPFVGRSGQLLRAHLSRHRIDPGEVAWMNVVSCRPPGNNTPTAKQVKACSYNLAAQVDVVDPEVIVLAGAVALSVFRPDLRVTSVHGHPFVPTVSGWPDLPGAWTRRPVFVPIFHPSAALRDAPTMAMFRDDMKVVGAVIRASNPFDGWPMTCVWCGNPGFMDSRDYLTWCEDHYPDTVGVDKPLPHPDHAITTGDQIALG